MLDMKADISARLPDGHVDIPRMRQGGLSAAFFSIWVDARYGPGTAFRRALALIDAVQALVDTQATAELATDADEVRGAVARGHIAVLMGVEGGHAIENSLEKLDSLYHRGVRYMTLTWNNGNDWAGSATDERRYRGRPGESAFEIDKFVGEKAESLGVPGLERLVDHIDHAVQVMGIDHVGLGSDFDGISVLPAPMKDATSLPLLVAALQQRGYADGEVAKILGENFLRLLSALR